MRIALCQLNPTVGDLRGNADLLLEHARQAAAEGAQLLVASELFVSGYPPKDLLLREGFVDACESVIDQLARDLPQDLGVLVGHPARASVHDSSARNCAARPRNTATLLYSGQRVGSVSKSLLPTYDVFDEERYFSASANPTPIEFKGRKLGVHICEDAWWSEPGLPYRFASEDGRSQIGDPVAQQVSLGADLLINLSASPFEVNKFDRRTNLAAQHARRHQLPFIMVNQVGGNDDLIFDGQSFVVDATGEVIHRLPAFESNLSTIDLDLLTSGAFESGALEPGALEPGALEPRGSREAHLYQALVVGLRDYVRKSRFSGVVFGLSGGIDSALVAAIATDGLGSKNVHGLLMPSRYSSDHSVGDAVRLAENLGIDHATVPIDPMHRSFEQIDVVGAELTGLTEQNLQSRIRGALVMARSNHHGWLPVATGNKSELAVGYCTLYGDMVGGYAPLADVYKTDVYRLSRYRNELAGRDLIPNSTIDKPPSAELAPDQFDQNELPPYDQLDAILYELIDQERSPKSLAAESKFSAEIVQQVARKLDLNEFKRRQLSPGAKVSARAFGSGRRMPIAARFDYEE